MAVAELQVVMVIITWMASASIVRSEVIRLGNEGVASPRAMNRMLRWFNSNGGVLGSGVAVEESKSGWCLRTTRDVVEGELLLHVPSAAGLHASVSSRATQRMLRRFRRLGLSPMQRRFHNDIDRIELMLVLIHEKLEGNKSHWEPYLNSLPKKVPQMKLHDEFLKNRSFLTTWQVPHFLFHHDYLMIQRIAILLPRFLMKRCVPRGRSAWILASWAVAIVRSRSFRIPKPSTEMGGASYEITQESEHATMQALIPGYDILDHDGGVEDVVFDTAERGGHLITISARHALPSRREVRWRYSEGARCETWAWQYGFVPDSLPKMVPGLNRFWDQHLLQDNRIATQVSQFRCLKEQDFTLQTSLINNEVRSILPPRLLICGRLLLLARHAFSTSDHVMRERLLDLASGELSTKLPVEAVENSFWASLNHFYSEELKLSRKVLEAFLLTKVLPTSAMVPLMDCAKFRLDVAEMLPAALKYTRTTEGTSKTDL